MLSSNNCQTTSTVSQHNGVKIKKSRSSIHKQKRYIISTSTSLLLLSHFCCITIISSFSIPSSSLNNNIRNPAGDCVTVPLSHYHHPQPSFSSRHLIRRYSQNDPTRPSVTPPSRGRRLSWSLSQPWRHVKGYWQSRSRGPSVVSPLEQYPCAMALDRNQTEGVGGSVFYSSFLPEDEFGYDVDKVFYSGDQDNRNAALSSSYLDSMVLSEDNKVFDDSSSLSLVQPQQQHDVFDETDQMKQMYDLIYHNDLSSRSSETQLSPSASSTTTTTSSNTKTQERTSNDLWTARLLLIAAAALYGTNFTLVKILDESVPVAASTSLRFVLAALVTLPWFLAPRSEMSRQIAGRDGTVEFLKDDGVWLRGASLAGLEIGLWNSIGYITQAIGLETMDASKSAFICSLAVVFVPIIDFLSGKPAPSLKTIMGIILAVFGVGLLELGDSLFPAAATSLTEMTTTAPLLAIKDSDWISFIQPLAFGIGFWRMEHAMRKYPTEATRLTAGQLLGVAAVSLACYCASNDIFAASSLQQIMTWITDPSIATALVWTGLITTALTIYMETMALKTLSAAETTLIFSTEPLWGSAFAASVVGEQFGIGAFLGGAFIIMGCILSNWQFGGNAAAASMSSDDGIN